MTLGPRLSLAIARLRGVLLASVLLAGPSAGRLVEADLVTPGDGLLTHDTIRGLEWLDLTATQGESFLSVFGGFGGYRTTHGFRFATSSDLFGLLLEVGSSVNETTVENRDGVELLLALLGCTGDCGAGTDYGQGLVIASTPSLGVTPSGVFSLDADGSSAFTDYEGNVDHPHAEADPNRGSFMVRDAGRPGLPGVSTLLQASSGGGPGSQPSNVVVDSQGNAYVGSRSNDVVRITPAGSVSVIIDASGDGAGNTLAGPSGIDVHTDGTVYVVGFDSINVFRITPAGAISEILDASGDGSGNVLEVPTDVAIDSSGNVFVVGATKVFRVTPAGAISLVTDQLELGYELEFAPSGRLYVTEFFFPRLLEILPGGSVQLVFEIPYPGAVISIPSLAIDADGNVYTGAWPDPEVYRVTPAGSVTEFFGADGNGIIGFDALFDVDTDSLGNVYALGHGSSNVFQIRPDGSATEILDRNGDGVNGFDVPGRLASAQNGERAFVLGESVFEIDLSPLSVPLNPLLAPVLALILATAGHRVLRPRR